MGSEKKRANDIIEVESLSAGSPAAEMRELIERGVAGGGWVGFIVAAGGAAFLGETFCLDCSGAWLLSIPEVLCVYTALYYHYNAIMKIVRAAVIGDVVGEPGLKVLEEKLPVIIKDNAVDFTVVNGENSADGFGMTEATLQRILACGVDIVTSGNHVWEKREFLETLNLNEKVLRPANYPSESLGRGWLNIEKAGTNWVIINMQGREFMSLIDCPFRCFDAIFKNVSDMENPVIIVDFHAESSREKEAFAYYLDSRVTLVAGTHTHVQTADERILPKGTAYITDLGMTGITNAIIGMDAKICLDRTRKQVLYRMEPAVDTQTNGKSNAEIQGILTEIDAESGKAVSIRRI
jgi:metallophosphoesterase (TIGR00282 family)